MNVTTRLKKLQEDKKLIIEALKQAQAKASTRQRKALTRLKIIYGGALLAMPAGEREALLSMITPRMVERDRRFVSEYEAGASESSEGQNGGGDV